MQTAANFVRTRLFRWWPVHLSRQPSMYRLAQTSLHFYLRFRRRAVYTVTLALSFCSTPNLSLLELVLLSLIPFSCCVVALRGDRNMTAESDWVSVFLFVY